MGGGDMCIAVHNRISARPRTLDCVQQGLRDGIPTWKMAFTIGAAQPPRIRTVPARVTTMVSSEIKKAKLRFGLAAAAPVLACYEAGRDGFWIHPFLVHSPASRLPDL